MKKLQDKTVLVTGGRQGIGRGIVDLFLAEGARVITCGRGARPEGLQDTVHWVKTDVSSSDEVKALGVHLRDRCDNVSIIINNAGVQIEKKITETTDTDWDLVMGVNAKGVFNICREFIPHMNNSGSIVNIGSISGNLSDPELALYNASKAFVHSLTRSIAVDHGPAIRCNAICPGWIMTDMADAAFDLARNPDAAKNDALSRHPAGRFGKPSDIANAALWLASDDSSFVTGQCFVIDGGLTSASPLQPGLF